MIKAFSSNSHEPLLIYNVHQEYAILDQNFCTSKRTGTTKTLYIQCISGCTMARTSSTNRFSNFRNMLYPTRTSEPIRKQWQSKLYIYGANLALQRRGGSGSHQLSDPRLQKYAIPNQNFCTNPTYPMQICLYRGKAVLDHTDHPFLEFKNMPSPIRLSTSIRKQRLSKPLVFSADLALLFISLSTNS